MKTSTSLTFLRKHLVFIFLLLPLIPAFAQSGYWSNYTAAPSVTTDSITITSAAELAWLAAEVNGGETFEGRVISLENHIDLSEHFWIPIGKYMGRILSDPYFSGTFNGNGKTISGLTTDGMGDFQTTGLFGYIGGSAVIRHVELKDIQVKGNKTETSITGGLVGFASNVDTSSPVVISGCSVTGNSFVEGGGEATGDLSQTGGLVGAIGGYWEMENCANSAVVTGGAAEWIYTGGLIGYAASSDNPASSITTSYSDGTVIGGEGDWVYTGGLIGCNKADRNSFTTLTDCYHTGSVTAGNGSSVNYTGGLVGRIDNYEGTVQLTACYAAGTLAGGASVAGGLAGCISVWNDLSEITLENSIALQTEFTIDDGGTANRIAGKIEQGPAGDGIVTCTGNYALIGGDTSPGWEDTDEDSDKYGTTLSKDPYDKDTYTAIFGSDFTDTWYMPLGGGELPQLIASLFGGGNGQDITPFIIRTRPHLEALAGMVNSIGHTFYGQYFRLEPEDGETLDLSEEAWIPIGTGMNNAFEGFFDGNSHKITGLWCDNTENVSGLFGYTRGAFIIDLHLVVDSRGMKTTGTLGALIGEAGHIGRGGGGIIHCSVTGEGTVYSEFYTGGLVGFLNVSMFNCYSGVAVENSGSAAGGLVGRVGEFGNIFQCFATGNVTLTAEGLAGGLAGMQEGMIMDSFATGQVTANVPQDAPGSGAYMGGLIGAQYKGAYLGNCYAIGAITSSGKAPQGIGGLIGLQEDGAESATITGCFFNTETTGQTQKVGHIGFLGEPNDSGITAATTLQMSAPATYLDAGWPLAASPTEGDDMSPWVIDPNYSYPFPYLYWLRPEGKEIDNPNPPTPPVPSHYYTLTLELGGAIHANYQAGDLILAEGESIRLQFGADDPAVTADEMLFVVDGEETTFNDPGANRDFHYTLRDIQHDCKVVIALRHYNVTLPSVSGGTTDPEAGTHPVAYGGTFCFTLTTRNEQEPGDIRVYANGNILTPDNDGNDNVYRYSVHNVTDHQTITIEGVDPTGNIPIGNAEMNITMDNGQLTIDNYGNPVTCTIYTLTGQLYTTRPLPEGTTTVDLPQGAYIVRAGETTVKVLIH